MEASFVPIPEGGEGAAAAEQGKPVGASAISFDLKLSTATFTFPEPLAKGKGTLKLSFQCDINNQVLFIVLRVFADVFWAGGGGTGAAGGGSLCFVVDLIFSRQCVGCWLGLRVVARLCVCLVGTTYF